MTNQEITVVYKWTANEGKAEELKAIYREVEKQMQANEPDALKVDCYFDDSTNTLIVYDLFKDAAALGLHLSTTAAGHFQDLLQIAVPGPFLFMGEVPEQLQQAAIGMGLDATFAPRVFGFQRALVH
ncbi:MAG: antibiotic biosynthesis monooxygenase [Bacteroidota bacterium]